MALDFDALRKTLANLQGQNNRSTATWKPPEGKSTIRIVPWKGNADKPFIELYFHYLGGKTQLSPLTKGNPDPIAEFADKLRSTGKDGWEQAKDFAPKKRTYVPVVVRGEEDKGVRFWGFGKTVYKELIAVMLDPDWGDITHPKTGRDILVEFTPKKKGSDAFAKTEIRVKPNTSVLTDNAEQLKAFLTKQPDIDEVFVAPTYEEMEAFLTRYVNGDKDPSVTATAKKPTVDEEEASEETAPAAVAAPTADEDTEDDVSPGEAPRAPEDKVAEEFERLFNSK